MIVSLDTETTGVDLYHAARPFHVTACTDAGETYSWSAPVDPMTRRVVWQPSDLKEIIALLDSAELVVMQNGKFDVAALDSVDSHFGKNWPWSKTVDTLLAAHLLASNQPKNLTALGIRYLGIDVSRHEERLDEVVKECRREVRQRELGWAIAAEGLPGMPSCKDKSHKYDMWLPKVLAVHDGLPDDHEWVIALDSYATADAELTVMLWPVMKREIERRKLWKIFVERNKASGMAYRMERRGVTLSSRRLSGLEVEFGGVTNTAEVECKTIAAGFEAACSKCSDVRKNTDACNSFWKRWAESGYDEYADWLPVFADACEDAGVTDERFLGFLRGQFPPGKTMTWKLNKELREKIACTSCTNGHGPYQLDVPRGGVNASLRTFMLDVLDLEPRYSKKSKTAEPTLDKGAMEHYLLTLPENSVERKFVATLLEKRTADTALAYMEAYRRFWVPTGRPGLYRLHPFLNPTGTDTLRWSSNNPNEQNISKKEGRNLRAGFGPGPGREWYSIDARGIEDRLPAFDAKEPELMNIFLEPDKPPYYGSNHFLRFSIVYPDVWAAAVREVGLDKAGPFVKKKYASTYYQWCKNGGFAVQYGAINREDGRGTADIAFRKPGAQALLMQRLSKLADLNRRCIEFAEKHGYVETIPDRSVDPERGYPLLCTRSEHGRILPTVPLNYRIQGSAMWWTHRGTDRTERYLWEKWLEFKKKWDGFVTMQVHDEIVLDLPKAADPRTDPAKSNLVFVQEIARELEKCGEDMGIPTPVGIEYHPVHWAEGFSLSY